MRLKLLISAAVMLTLTACGSDDSSSANKNSMQLSFGDIAGVYNTSSDGENTYISISSDGSYNEYYLETNYNNQTCYEKYSGQMTSLGDNKFNVSSPDADEDKIIELSLDGNDLISKYVNENETVITTAYASNKTEAEFTPLCS